MQRSDEIIAIPCFHSCVPYSSSSSRRLGVRVFGACFGACFGIGAASLVFADDADCDDLASGVALGFGAAFAFAATSASLRMSSVVGILAIAAT